MPGETDEDVRIAAFFNCMGCAADEKAKTSGNIITQKPFVKNLYMGI
jgi:hypothetical protein